MKVAISLVVVVAVVVLGGIIIGGCESTQTSNDVMAVTPASVTLNVSNLVAAFTVTAGSNALVLPLEWSVADASLGKISSSASLTAVYESSGATGANTVVVHDQTQAQGAASVIQQ